MAAPGMAERMDLSTAALERAWCIRFGVTATELRQIVRRVGLQADAADRYVRQFRLGDFARPRVANAAD